MKLRQKFTKTAAVLLSAVMLGSFSAAGFYSKRLPEAITAESASGLTIAEYPELSCCGSPVGDDNGRVTLSLFGAIPVKSVAVQEKEAPTLIAGGHPFGIKLLMEGVMVTDIGSVEAENGKTVSPAKNCGIETGDVICAVNGEPVTSNGHLQELIGKSGGRGVELTVNRGESRFRTTLMPVFSVSKGKWLGGMWVRDSIAGIGTMTFIDKKTGEFAGLGHPICDSDTGEIVPIHSGEAVHVDISETKRGQKGVPGELRGKFDNGSVWGSLHMNNKSGIFGRLTEQELAELAESGQEFKMGYRQDVTRGHAEILATVSGSTPKRYDIEIERVDHAADDSTKNMVIRITDPRLIEQSGGIVQGMSGSPIIQNGKLIGAVTHVFVSDPTRGYGIFAELMRDSMQNA